MKKAFTLIELLIATSLAVIIMTAAIHVLSGHSKIFQRLNQKASHAQICSMVLDTISEDIQSNNNISYDYKDGKVRRIKGKSISYLTDEGDLSSFSVTYKGNLAIIKADKYETKAFKRL